MSLSEKQGIAVVIGGSIAGSTAAVALAPCFDRVVVLDRDALPEDAAPRKGAPHAHQFHGLTIGGRRALDQLLPGFSEDMIKAGVPEGSTSDVRHASKYGWQPQFDSELRVLLPTRRFIEWYLRSRAKEHGNVEYRSKTVVSGLRVSDGIVAGVAGTDEGGADLIIEADLVVDASGRASRAPDWLVAAGYAAPFETTVNAHWGYATTYVRPPAGYDPGYKALYMGPTVDGGGPAATRGAAMFSQEDGQWVITAQGCAGDYPPADEEGFRAYLGSFGGDEFIEMLDKFERITPIEAWRNTTNRFRDFVGLVSRPENFLVVGDANAAFNPIYGQGMSVAAISAKLLSEYLAEGNRLGGGFAENFQKRVDATVTQPCWALSTQADYKIPGVEVDGAPQVLDPNHSSDHEYTDRLLALATEDPEITRKFWETVHILRGPEWMADEDLKERVRRDWDRLGRVRRTA